VLNVPASDSGNRVGGRVRTGGSKSSVADGRAGRDGSGELEDRNIAVKSGAREAGVDLDGRDLDEGASRAPVLRRLLASSFAFECTLIVRRRRRESKVENWNHLQGIQREP
jgi:hypothetical protein